MQIQNISAPTFTRPDNSTAYAAAELVANSATAASVVPLLFTDTVRDNSGWGMIRKARIAKSTTTTTAATFKLHLYTASPTVANGDNGAWSTTISGYLGAISVATDRAFTNGAVGDGVPTIGTEINYRINGGTTLLYGLLEVTAAYAPGALETFTVTLEVLS